MVANQGVALQEGVEGHSDQSRGCVHDLRVASFWDWECRHPGLYFSFLAESLEQVGDRGRHFENVVVDKHVEDSFGQTYAEREGNADRCVDGHDRGLGLGRGPCLLEEMETVVVRVAI